MLSTTLRRLNLPASALLHPSHYTCSTLAFCASLPHPSHPHLCMTVLCNANSVGAIAHHQQCQRHIAGRASGLKRGVGLTRALSRSAASASLHTSCEWSVWHALAFLPLPRSCQPVASARGQLMLGQQKRPSCWRCACELPSLLAGMPCLQETDLCGRAAACLRAAAAPCFLLVRIPGLSVAAALPAPPCRRCPWAGRQRRCHGTRQRHRRPAAP